MARILVVDDDRDFLKLVQKFLLSEGFEVLLATNAIDAMDFLDRSGIDLLILDVNMPRINGYQIANTLRSAIKFEKLPIVFVTGRSDKKDIERAIKIGVTEYMVKPIIRDAFVSKIKKILEKAPQSKSLGFKPVGEDPGSFRNLNIKVRVKVENISESGIHVLADRKLSEENTLVDFENDFFETIGVKPAKLNVVSGSQLEAGGWRYFLQFVGIDKEFSAKLRAWLIRQSKVDSETDNKSA